MRLNTRRLVASLVCAGVVTWLAGAAFAQTDPHVGVWKLDVAKSKYDPGPGPKSGTTTIEAAGKGTKVVVDQEFAEGARHWEFTAGYDGKDAPVTGNPETDTVARTRVNAHTVKTVNKKGGKIVTTQTSTVSSDGKTRTVTTTGVNAKGEKVHNVAVYTRQ
jgi:hypothetical protein